MRPFVKSQKNDYADAEAIAEAVQRPTMRFVPIKTDEQLDVQALHRVRDRLVERRTCLINQFRAFLLERGITVRTGREALRHELPALLVSAEQQLSGRMYHLLERMVEEWNEIDKQIEQVSVEIEAVAVKKAAAKEKPAPKAKATARPKAAAKEKSAPKAKAKTKAPRKARAKAAPAPTAAPAATSV